MQHTPGPWTVSARQGKRPSTIVLDADRNEVCEVYAASHLIAAAPAMLEALQRCAAILARYPKHDDAWTQARAAIRAATGED